MHSVSATRATRSARRASRSPAAHLLARAGLTARGVIYLLVGWVAVLVALGHSTQEADQQGALQLLAGKPYGLVSLWLLGIGFVAYALWRFSEAAFGVAGEGNGAGPRLKSLVRGLVYAALAYLTFQVIAGVHSNEATKQQDATASVMHHAGGRWLVGIVGLIIVVAGVAGTAITADLGARKVREELDALQVLGVDPVKNLVVPRFLALMVVTGLFDIYALLFGIFGGIIAELVNGQALGPFWNTLFANASTTDLWGSVLKTTIYGAIIAIVCCYKGMSASGGAEGVGRAVNEAVVLTFTAIFAFDYVFTQTLLATHPSILVIK